MSRLFEQRFLLRLPTLSPPAAQQRGRFTPVERFENSNG